MTDFEAARQQALAQMQQTHCCRVLTAPEVARRKLRRSFAEVWLLDAEVFGPDETVRPLQFLVGLPADFPLVLPTIFLDRADYERTRYLPHVDSTGLVCAFDPETVQVNPADPHGIVRACLGQARQLLEQGLAGTNTGDFQQEFIAYWEDRYAEQDNIETGISLTAMAFPAGPCELLRLSQPLGGYSLVLPADATTTRSFREVLKRRAISVETTPAFHLGELGDTLPPFNFSNGGALALAKAHFPGQWEDLRRYLNGTSTALLVVFHKRLAGQVQYFGWQHTWPQLKQRKGFRPDKLSTMGVLTTLDRSKPVWRLSFDTLTSQRLTQRTAGEPSAHEYTLLVAGLGSIGSNLLHLLASFPLREMRLVDTEPLALENINRHLLGIDDVGVSKVEGLQRYLERQQPLRTVSVRKESIAQVARREPAYLNECDAIILAVGRSTVEQYLLELQALKVLTRPIFVLWVEPYLAGGHLLYFPPGHTTNYGSLFTEGYYNYNVLATAEYRRPANQMLLKEAGCQTSYVPYSQEYVTLFLGRIFPELRRLLRHPAPEAWAFTWLGNCDAIIERGLAKSGFTSSFAEGDLIPTKL
ncbi:E2/UBC family protein [Hymenobacter ruber]